MSHFDDGGPGAGRGSRAPQGSSAVVLAGGRASRLGAIASDTPKALLEVCGTPFLRLLLEKLRREGVDDFVVVTGHLGEAVEGFLELLPPSIGRVETVRSTEGTGPAFAEGLRRCKRNTVLLLNGDTILAIDYGELLRVHSTGSSVVTIVTTTRRGVPNEGAVKVSAKGVVLSFDEAGQGPASADSQLGEGSLEAASVGNESNCGCYAVTRSALGGTDRWTGSFERQVLPGLVAGGKVRSMSIGDRFFLDFGTPGRLAAVIEDEATIRDIYGLADSGS